MTMRGVVHFSPKNKLTEKLIQKVDQAAKIFSRQSAKVFKTRRRGFKMGERYDLMRILGPHFC